MEIHKGVITKETPIPVSGNSVQDAELKSTFEENPLFTILDALISANNND